MAQLKEWSKVNSSQRLYRNAQNVDVVSDCPTTVLQAIPNHLERLPFTSLVANDDYRNKCILGQVVEVFPICARKNGHLRKIVLSDGLSRDRNSDIKLTMYLFDDFAKDSFSIEKEGYIAVSNFKVEQFTSLTQTTSRSLGVQVLVMVPKDNSVGPSIWIVRKLTENVEDTRDDNISDSITNEMQSEPVDESTNREYTYNTLSELRVSTSRTDFFSIYAVVENCNLRLNQGNNSQNLELKVFDPTMHKFQCIVHGGKDETFPNVHPGDIIRIHRLLVDNVRNKLRGNCYSSKFVLIFSQNDNGENPQTTARTYVFTEEDRAKVDALFDWIANSGKRKFISDIKLDELSTFLCQVISVYIAKSTNCVILRVWDGTKNNQLETTYQKQRDEVADQTMVLVARDLMVNLWVCGTHCLAAGELRPGQFIEVCDTQLLSTRRNPDDLKLWLHNKHTGKGITVINSDDQCLDELKVRLKKIKKERNKEIAKEMPPMYKHTSILNSGISASVPQDSQTRNMQQTTDVRNTVDHTDQAGLPSTSRTTALNTNTSEPIRDRVIPAEQMMTQDFDTERLISVMSVGVLPGQSTQTFGGTENNEHPTKRPRLQNPADINDSESLIQEALPTAIVNRANDNVMNNNLSIPETQRTSVVPSRTIPENILVNQNRYDSAFPDTDDWWRETKNCVTRTDNRSDVKPTPLADVVTHSVPSRFRIIAVAMNCKPEIDCIEKLIRLYCPKCYFLSGDVSQKLKDIKKSNSFLPSYHCTECEKSGKETELQFIYLLSFSLYDGTSSVCLQTLLWKENAVKFFKWITPEQALTQKDCTDSIFDMLYKVCPNARQMNSDSTNVNQMYPLLDCCLMSYAAGGRTRYQIFDTVVL